MMKVIGIAFLGLFLSFGYEPVAALNSKSQTKLKPDLINEILRDASNLKLPENRALAYAFAGNAVWKSDKDKARSLFTKSIAELIQAQKEYESDVNRRFSVIRVVYGRVPRSLILGLIAERDAEYALSVLVSSRPQTLKQALLEPNARSLSGTSNEFHINQEAATERKISSIAIQQNPNKAVKVVRNSIKQGLSTETLNFVHLVEEKEPVVARKLASEIATKLLDDNFAHSVSRSRRFHFFLSMFGFPTYQGTAPVLTDDLIQKLTDQISQYWLAADDFKYYQESKFPMFIKSRFPVRWKQINERLGSWLKKRPSADNSRDAYYLFMRNNPSVEELIKRAGEFPSRKNEIYPRAAAMLVKRGKAASAEKLLNRHFPPKSVDDFLRSIYYSSSQSAAIHGNFTRAKMFAEKIPPGETRLNLLIFLAQQLRKQDAVNGRKKALGILTESIGKKSSEQTARKVSRHLKIARAFGDLDPDFALSLVTPLVPSLNDYTSSYEKVSRFNQGSDWRNGEYVIFTGLFNSGAYVSKTGDFVNSLKTANRRKVLEFINRFDRAEIRLFLKLRLIADIPRHLGGKSGTSSLSL